jgi:hypothetical protein
MLPSTVFRAARALREADATLWPEAAKGGGRGAAHVEPQHLVNLAIAVAASDYITRAPQVVVGYRGLIWNTAPRIPPQLTGQATSLLQTQGLLRRDITAGKHVEGIVRLLADGGEDVSRALLAVGYRVDLDLNPRVPRMVIGYTETDLPDDAAPHEPKFVFRPRQTPVGLSRKSDPAWNFLGGQDQFILKSATLLTPLFVMLADLWNDTRQHQKRTPPVAPASANPESETAASPLPGAAAARLTQPPVAERTSEHLQRSNRSEEREERQPFSAGAGKSFNKEKPPNAYRTDVAAS